ncbi:MAG: DUF166 domain-containing protein [Halobacteriota archaeon]|nr:DUF166 domain-containing protein [Halobacteriota archaeon]
MNFKSDIGLIIIYSGTFGERVIGNLINYSTFCVSCAEACTHCRENKFDFSGNIKGIFKLPEPATLPEFIEDGIESYLPKSIPEADVAIVSEIHNDILLELPKILKESGIKAIIIPIETPTQLAISQIKELCQKHGIEVAFPKPFCDLEPQEDLPLISRFVDEFGIGRPKLKIELDSKRRIASMDVLRSEPCGCAWFVSKQILGLRVDDQRELWNQVSEAHHSYPCTAGMQKDWELKDTILHKAGYIIRTAVEEAYEGTDRED